MSLTANLKSKACRLGDIIQFATDKGDIEKGKVVAIVGDIHSSEDSWFVLVSANDYRKAVNSRDIKKIVKKTTSKQFNSVWIGKSVKLKESLEKDDGTYIITAIHQRHTNEAQVFLYKKDSFSNCNFTYYVPLNRIETKVADSLIAEANIGR